MVAHTGSGRVSVFWDETWGVGKGAREGLMVRWEGG